MKKLGILFSACMLLLAGCGSTPNTSNQQPKDLPYNKVVAGTGSIAEYLAAFEIPLVGVTEQDSIPEMYKDATRVGQPRKLNVEILMSLEPDLFIGDKALLEVNDKDLAGIELNKLYLDNSSYDGVFASIKMIGETFTMNEQADKIVKDLKSKESSVLKGIDDLKGKKVVVLFGTGESYMLATKHSYIGSLLEKLGVENVANSITEQPRPYVQFSLETVVAENPDYILTLAHGNKEQAAQAFAAEMEKELWKQTPAVQNKQTYPLDDKEFPVTGNIHIMETLENLKNLLKGN